MSDEARMGKQYVIILDVMILWIIAWQYQKMLKIHIHHDQQFQS
jgi:hypothetical protein